LTLRDQSESEVRRHFWTPLNQRQETDSGINRLRLTSGLTNLRAVVRVMAAIECKFSYMISLALAILILVTLGFASPAVAAGDPSHGEYVARLGGCHSCHTNARQNGAPLAGGVALTSQFGTFHVPNITPDTETGIGGWSDNDFIRAMTDGVAPNGSHYYPAYPFTSYTRMRRQDLLDLKAYLDTVKPVHNQVPTHDLRFPYNFRFLLGAWKWLFFLRGPFKPDPGKNAVWNRGAYLVTGPGHCGECHTARSVLGATDEGHALAGAKQGPDGNSVPNITPHRKEGIGLWSAQDVVDFLKTGELPFGEEVDPPMDDVITNSTSHWTVDDRTAIATYLLSLQIRTTP
jgi:mono/diheme cytochrome c family protein